MSVSFKSKVVLLFALGLISTNIIACGEKIVEVPVEVVKEVVVETIIVKEVVVEKVVNKSKTTGEPPLMNAMSVFFAIKDAIASVGDYNTTPIISAPATPEKILMSIKKLQSKS